MAEPDAPPTAPDIATVAPPAASASQRPWEGDTALEPGRPPSQTERPWLKDRPLESTPGQKVGALGERALGEFVKGTASLGGMSMGAAIGTTVGGGPGVGTAVGASLGFGAGQMFGTETERQLGIRRVEEMPEDQRPWGVAGEVLGGGIPFMALPLYAAQAGVRLPSSKVGRFLNKIVDYAAAKPFEFAAVELGSLFTAGGGGFAAEQYDPNNVPLRLTSEIVGGIFNPTRLVANLGKRAWSVGSSWVSSVAPGAAQETQAGRILREIVEMTGEDPAALSAALRAADLPGLNLTSGQKTGSEALIAMERKLIRDNARFGVEAEKSAREGLETLENMVTALRGTGDPGALRAAAQLREVYFRTLFANMVRSAEEEAVDAARRISGDTPRLRAVLGVRTEEILTQSLRDARAAERQLYDAIPRQTAATADNSMARYESIRDELLPEESLPPIIEGFIRRMRGEAEPSNLPDDIVAEIRRVFGEAPRARVPGEPPTDVGELLRFRSRALALARDADAAGRPSEARHFGQMAEAALDDIGSVADPAVREAVDLARTFSRELHDTFTRSFAGEAMAVRQSGAPRIPPEAILSQAIGRGREVADVRLRQIEEATSFMVRHGMASPEAARNVGTMIDAQERIIRLAAAEAVDPNTGRASALRLGRFLQNNEGLLDRFPEVRRQMQEAVRTERNLRDVDALARGASPVVERRAAFAKVAGVESPADAIAKAIASDNPEAELSGMLRLARRGGADAVEGFQAAIWDNALRDASRGAEFSFERLGRAMTEPLRPGLPSLATFMVRHRLMTAGEATRLGEILVKVASIERSMIAGSRIDDLVPEPNGLLSAYISAAGSKFGGWLARLHGGGSTLIAQSRGAEYFRSIFQKIPVGQTGEVLRQAARNPEFAAVLLERSTSQAKDIMTGRRLHAYLLASGLTAAEDTETEE